MMKADVVLYSMEMEMIAKKEFKLMNAFQSHEIFSNFKSLFMLLLFLMSEYANRLQQRDTDVFAYECDKFL